MMDWSRKEGEILFFGEDTAWRGMLSALSGVSGEGDPAVLPRLCIADGEDPGACEQCIKNAEAAGAATLFIGGAPRGAHHLPRPFLFSDFTDFLREFFAASPTPDPPASSEDAASFRLALSADGWASFGESRCHLSPAEAQILRLLMQSAPAPVSRERLVQVFAGKRGNGVDVYISYLRRKLRDLTPFVGIVSVRGQGYALVGGESIQK